MVSVLKMSFVTPPASVRFSSYSRFEVLCCEASVHCKPEAPLCDAFSGFHGGPIRFRRLSELEGVLVVLLAHPGCLLFLFFPYRFDEFPVRNRVFQSFIVINYKSGNHKSLTYNPQQHGAAEARRAHNPEGPRSKRGVAICFAFLLAVAS